MTARGEMDEASLKATLRYGIGFVMAISLTIVAYFAVMEQWVRGANGIGVIMVLAVIQLAVQLIFFLRLGRRRNGWNVAAFLFMMMVLLIVVVGSLWIMYNMNYNMRMTPEQMNAYMRGESSKGF